jgi:hypothetical protein
MISSTQVQVVVPTRATGTYGTSKVQYVAALQAAGVWCCGNALRTGHISCWWTAGMTSVSVWWKVDSKG